MGTAAPLGVKEQGLLLLPRWHSCGGGGSRLYDVFRNVAVRVPYLGPGLLRDGADSVVAVAVVAVVVVPGVTANVHF